MERFGLPKRSINWVLRQPDKATKGETGRCLECGAFVYLPCIECITNACPSIPTLPPSEDCDLQLRGPELKRYLEIKRKKDEQVNAAIASGDGEYAREQRLLELERDSDEFFDEGTDVVVPE